MVKHPYDPLTCSVIHFVENLVKIIIWKRKCLTGDVRGSFEGGQNE